MNIPVMVRDDTGAQIATDTITLAANGHLAFTSRDRQISGHRQYPRHHRV